MGRIVTVSGPRGAGKTTVMHRLSDVHGIDPIVPYTTRGIRDTEIDGRDYHFVDRLTFLDMMTAETMFDVLEIQGQYYGTPEKQLYETLRGDKIRTFNVACDTALNLQKKYGYGLIRTVMLLPNSMQDIQGQMRDCGVDEDEIAQRMRDEPNKLSLISAFNQVIVNERGKLDQTVAKMVDYVNNISV